MARPQQIGSSTKVKLLYSISKALDRVIKIAGNS